MMQKNFKIYHEDLEIINSISLSKIKLNKELNIFCSFTYITPNYSILFTLNELKKFVGSENYKIFIIIWDMNILANPYFKRLIASKLIEDSDSFINEKLIEIKNIINSLGFNGERILIYKSSNLWRRLVSIKNPELFSWFYKILSELETKELISINKGSHLIQMSVDLFFCNYFHLLYPEDTSKPMDLAFLGEQKKRLYISIRELMYINGMIKSKRPLFILMETFPYIIYNHTMPEWNMVLEDILDLLLKCKLNKKEVFQTFKYLVQNKEDNLYLLNNKIIEYNKFIKDYNNKKLQELIQILSINLFKYLQNYKKKYLGIYKDFEDNIINVSNKRDVKMIGKVLKSDIALQILLLADGSKNTTQIAKEIEKSITTISTYISQLKKEKLLRVLPNGMIKRNIKGIKINFELGIK